jgi:hypothetical protein
MARFMIEEIGNVPLAPDEASQEAVQSFMARNPPGNALVIRNNDAREAYGYEVSPEPEEAREDMRRLQKTVRWDHGRDADIVQRPSVWLR